VFSQVPQLSLATPHQVERTGLLYGARSHHRPCCHRAGLSKILRLHLDSTGKSPQFVGEHVISIFLLADIYHLLALSRHCRTHLSEQDPDKHHHHPFLRKAQQLNHQPEVCVLHEELRQGSTSTVCPGCLKHCPEPPTSHQPPRPGGFLQTSGTSTLHCHLLELLRSHRLPALP